MLSAEQWITVAFASLFAVTPTVLDARSVDYSQGAATIIQSGQELKITPLTTELHPHTRVGSLTSLPTTDHTTLALGMYCSAYKIENPISQLLFMVQNEWNAAATVSSGAPATELDVTITSASSYRRCIEVGEMNVRCITRVKLSGTARSMGYPSAGSVPIYADVERDASVGGFCGSLSRGVGVISREAALALLADAEHKVATPPIP